jgi:hypothetical protein
MKILAFILTFLQIMNTGGSRKVFSPVTCTGLPSYSAQFKASTTAPGSVGSWNDSSGNSNTANMVGGGSPVVSGTSQPTPNGGETVVFINSVGQYATLTNTISTSTAGFACAVYEVNNTTVANVFTGNPTQGSFEYSANQLSTPFGQNLNSGFVSVIGSGTAAGVAGVWMDTCVTYTVGGAWAFYKNGVLDGSGTSSTTFSQPISQIFKDRTSTQPIFAIAELDIGGNASLTSTQATAIHNCAVSTYGVP